MHNTSTKHEFKIGAAQKMGEIKSNSIELIVTSPPYPMIEMWDEILSTQNSKISKALQEKNGPIAFELMHKELDKVWSEVERVLIPGGFACINIGDATRKIGPHFSLYPNHARIISSFINLGLTNLPNILWRKQTNAPNKFMGSGMLPSGAYVTLEHEWILIFRKGSKREFKTETEKLRRKESAFFWEERNRWFSDLWDLKGTKQKINSLETRKRSAAFPFELPYRLINMYSLQGDTVLDPFLGIGTTTIAAITAQRNSIGYEIDPNLLGVINSNVVSFSKDVLNTTIQNRISQHVFFLISRNNDPKKDKMKHFNENLKMQVMTSQETHINLSLIDRIQSMNQGFLVFYHPIKQPHNKIISEKQLKLNI